MNNIYNLEIIKHLYPFKSNYYELPEGYKIHYINEGKGEPILMLHGNPTWSFFYRRFIQKLKDNYNCIAPDHLGCGLSDKPQYFEYTLKNHIENLISLINFLNLKDITLILHDWGGAIGMGYAIKYPTNIKRIIILNTGAFNSPPNYYLPWRIRICKFPLIGTIGIKYLNLFAKLALLVAVKHRGRITSDIKKGYLFPYNSFNNRKAILEFVRDIPLSPKHKTYKILAEIEEKLVLLKNKPILILWAGQDFVLNYKILKRWEEIFPSAEVNVYKDAGHYIQEDAYERIIPKIEEFLIKNK